MAGAVVAVALVFALAITQGRAGDSNGVARDGRPAPPFTLGNLQPGGPPVSLKALRGRPAVINFWASWCVPCRKEMPGFEATHQSLGERVTFVGINNKDFRDSALDFLKKTGVSYPSGFDPSGNVAAAYGVIGMPSTFFISDDGRLLESRTGEINLDELRATISRLFGIS